LDHGLVVSKATSNEKKGYGNDWPGFKKVADALKKTAM
jgi:hypothetical protein